MNILVMMLSCIAWLAGFLVVVFNDFSADGLNIEHVLGVLILAPVFFAYAFWNEFKEKF
jgi:ABC-type transport system involved in cytochrome bd biosynthesis fused ATPase/permease subunit